MVRGCHRPRSHSCQFVEDHEQEFSTGRETEIPGSSVRRRRSRRIDVHSRSSEQRVSTLLMAILTGLSVFFTHILGVRLLRLCLVRPSSDSF